MAALTALCNNNNGFVLLTDTLTPDTSDFFLVKKSPFLEILAGVQNNQIIVDPVGKILPGQVLSVPFHLSDADIQATTILLTDIPALRMRLRTPAGDMIDPTLATSVGAQYTVGQNLVFYRYLLPLAVGAGAQSGTWNAVLEMDPAIVKRCKEDGCYGIAATSIAQQPSVCQGVRYSVQVHAWSNLRMKARILQTSFAPGATLTVRAVLTEYTICQSTTAPLFRQRSLGPMTRNSLCRLKRLSLEFSRLARVRPYRAFTNSWFTPAERPCAAFLSHANSI